MGFNPAVEIGWDIFQHSRSNTTIHEYWSYLQWLYREDMPDWVTWENVILGWNYAQYRIVEARWVVGPKIQLKSL